MDIDAKKLAMLSLSKKVSDANTYIICCMIKHCVTEQLHLNDTMVFFLKVHSLFMALLMAFVCMCVWL